MYICAQILNNLWQILNELNSESHQVYLNGRVVKVEDKVKRMKTNRIMSNNQHLDKKTLEFVTYCIGKLSVQLNMPQKEIYKRLKTSGILYDYIVPSYDVLHTFSSRYLMEDLTEYMREKGVLPA